MSGYAVTGVSPNMAMFEKEVRLPPPLLHAGPPKEPFDVTVPFVSDLGDTLSDAHEKVRAKTQAVARTQKVLIRRAF